jgi:hypothetical protein
MKRRMRMSWRWKRSSLLDLFMLHYPVLYISFIKEFSASIWLSYAMHELNILLPKLFTQSKNISPPMPGKSTGHTLSKN